MSRATALLCSVLAFVACNDDRGGSEGDMAQPRDSDMAPSGPRTCSINGASHQLSNLTGQHAYPRIAANGLGYIVAWLSGIPGSPPTFRIDAELTDKMGNKL